MRLPFAEVQRNVFEIANRQKYTIDVIYELMAAYGRSASSITKLRNGVINLAEDKENTVLQRGVVYLKTIESAESLPAEVEKIEKDPLTARYNPRFLIATDLKYFAAKDTKKGNTLEIAWEDVDRNVDFFYGWTGDEVTDEKTEAVADRRAADKMKELYNEIEVINRDKLAEKGNTFRHDLNVFFTRLLFCFFAEDTKVFSKADTSIFIRAIKDYTQTDGSDLDQFLNTLFNALDSEDKSNFTSPFSNFPYVNGTLFDTKRNIAIPKFNAQARKYILDCGVLNWAEINPDIFGSMFQSIVDEDQRATHGQHYTSVPNIMKTIEPLFLDELREDFDKYYDNPAKLIKLHNRLSKIKIFDPACGSGNFLIIAYKELRKLEHAIIERLYEDDFKKAALAGRLSTRIDLNNFYGIEIDDFACEVAVLSLYLAKHQMNIEFEKQFGKEIKLIPLKDKANIHQGNSTRVDWQKVCPNVEHSIDIQRVNEQSSLIKFDDKLPELELGQKYWDEIYLISNPPYLGSSLQDADQKKDMSMVFSAFNNYKNLDLIAAWFKLGADYISDSKAKLAFVTTNSICQGEQVALLWPYIFEKNIEIGFAHSSFKWKNGARDVAGVTVVIIGLRNISTIPKYIYKGGIRAEATQINAYLSEGDNVIITKRTKPLSNIPRMGYGCKPVDGGNLIFDTATKQEVVSQHPGIEKFIRKFVSGQDYLNQQTRWCLWISDADFDEAYKYDFIKERVDAVRDFRLGRKDKGAQDMAKKPYQFREFVMPPENSILVPSTSSERREYIPIDYLPKDVVANNASFVIFNAPLFIFGIVSSRMHMVWQRAVGGALETRLRYSSALVYNTFPFQSLNDTQLQDISTKARNVIFSRQNHSEKTLAEMYDPDKMPNDVREAHKELDLVVDQIYRAKPYTSDNERLTDLFALYEQMIESERK